MKKHLCLALCLCVLILLCSCGSNQQELPTSSNSDNSQSQAAIASSTVSTDTDTSDEVNSAAASSEQAISTDTIIDPVNITTENMRPTLLDNSDVRLSINSFTYANSKSIYELNIQFENNSNQNLAVLLTDVIVDGYDISTSQGKTTVSPGNKAICNSSILERDLQDAGITEWDTAEGVIEVRQGIFGKALYSVPVTLEKSCWEYDEEYTANNPLPVIAPSDLTDIPTDSIVISADNLNPTLLDESGITVSVTSFEYANNKTVYEINFALENSTEQDISISLNNVVVEGYEISTSEGKSMAEAGHKAVCDSSIWQRDMDQFGLNDWIVLKGTVTIREGYWGDVLYQIPVVIYKDAWTATN